MKKTTFYTALVLFVMAAAACRKVSCDPKNGNTDYKQCVITALSYSGAAFGDPVHFDIVYNDRHDPVSATPDFIGTGSPQRVFYYDAAGRLISYAGIYTNGLFETWHNFQYDSRGRIVGDSTYVFGPVSNPGSAPDRRFSSFTYDSENRIVSETMTSGPLGQPGPFVKTYVYDASGNLAGIAHDSKPNLLLTNKVWRFLNRNYSVNNLASATTYNDHGLPLSFSGGAPPLFENLSAFSQLEVTYDCGGPIPSIGK